MSIFGQSSARAPTGQPIFVPVPQSEPKRLYIQCFFYILLDNGGATPARVVNSNSTVPEIRPGSGSNALEIDM